MNKTYLIVVSHPDDEILGFGGSGYKFTNAGDEVYPLILSGKVEARKDRPETEELYKNIKNANDLLGFKKPKLGDFPNIKFNNINHIDLVKFIESYIEEIQPTHIYTHHPNDLNNDHHHTSISCQAAARLFQRKDGIRELEELCFMEISSSTDWAFPSNNSYFKPNLYIDISSTIEKKIDALKLYQNVLRINPHPRSKEVIKSLANYRGSQCNSYYAEAFEIVYKKV